MSEEFFDGFVPKSIYVNKLGETTPEQAERVKGHPLSPSQHAAAEIFDVFLKHKLTYDQCISVMVATTKLLGRKADNNPVGAFLIFLDKAMKLVPELGDVPDNLAVKLAAPSLERIP